MCSKPVKNQLWANRKWNDHIVIRAGRSVTVSLKRKCSSASGGLTMTIFLGAGGCVLLGIQKREASWGRQWKVSQLQGALWIKMQRIRAESGRGGRESAMCSARVSSPARVAGHGLSGCATDGFRSACAALVSTQETETMNRKKDWDHTRLLPVYRLLYT